LRRLLYWTLRGAGMVGIREEWWHYSLGDQEWAAQLEARHARYGAVDAPS
jgi:D-alanyl-D-alanine dipeptidase